MANPGSSSLDSILFGINIGGLVLVVYQSWLTRRALKVTDEGLRVTRRSVHLEMLPRGNVVVHVVVTLERFQQTLAEQIVRLDRAYLGDLNALKEASSHGEHKAKGLIMKPMYDSCPGWLQAIYEAGVQHYYQANGPFVRSLWTATADVDGPTYTFTQNFEADTVLSNLRDARAQITNLLGMLKDLLPDEWLHSPATLTDRDFFDR